MKFFAAASATLLFTLTAVCAGPFRAGVASVDITPEPGTPMAGYYSERGADGTHDPLWAKAIVLEQDGAKAALVALDLIGTMHGFVEEARAHIEREIGIPATNIMISGTHSHTGPIFAGNRRHDAISSSSEKAQKYTAGLPGLIRSAVAAAHSNLQSAALSYATVELPGVAFNRRFHMRDGTVGWNPGKLNPNIVRAAGPVDEEVQVVYFEREAKPLATYVNFAMHLDTVGGTHFSADYPYTLGETLAKVKGPEMLTLFTIGCAGDINHLNVKSAQRQGGHGEAARIGTHLASAVLRAFEELTVVSNATLRISRETVKLPLPTITVDEIAAASQIVDQVARGEKPAPKFLDQVKAFKVMDVKDREGQPWEVEVQVIAAGTELAWVSLPGEIFVELGMSIKAGSPFKQTIIAELANGSIGYIPTRRAYGEGNYEVVSARCAEGSGELLVESAVRQLRGLWKNASYDEQPAR